MSKIKYINCFGSSYTAGGGFEFESVHFERRQRINKVYRNFDSKEKTQFNFSWPGQLQKILKGSNIKVKNFGKQGYGNQRTFRKCYDLINSFGFNKDEHIFLIEFTDLGREEFFCKELNDYVICNYSIEDPNLSSCAKSYYYDDVEERKTADIFYDRFMNFFPPTFEMRNKVNQLNRELEFFISYLLYNKINWIITSTGNLSLWDIKKKFKEKEISFGDGNYFSKNTCFHSFATLNKLTISHESNRIHDDFHCGYIANEIISKTIYNFLCNNGHVDGKELDIDYKKYKEMNFLKYLMGGNNLI